MDDKTGFNLSYLEEQLNFFNRFLPASQQLNDLNISYFDYKDKFFDYDLCRENEQKDKITAAVSS